MGETYGTLPKAWEEMPEREYTFKKKYTWNALQDRAYVRPQKKSQKFLFFLPPKIGSFGNSGEKDWNTKHPGWAQGNKARNQYRKVENSWIREN